MITKAEQSTSAIVTFHCFKTFQNNIEVRKAYMKHQGGAAKNIASTAKVKHKCVTQSLFSLTSLFSSVVALNDVRI